MGDAENILKQTLYEMVIALLTPGSDTGGFLCYEDYSVFIFVTGVAKMKAHGFICPMSYRTRSANGHA